MSESEPGRLAGKTILFSGEPTNVAHLAEACRAQGGKAVWWGPNPRSVSPDFKFDGLVKLNAKSIAGCEAALMVIKRRFGHLHGAVNCIATPGVGPLLTTTDRDWKLVGEAVADTGVQTKAQIGRMLETGGGNIVNWVARGSYESELDTILAKCIFELTLGFRAEYGPNNIGAVPFYGWMDDSDMFEHMIQISSVDPGLAD